MRFLRVCLNRIVGFFSRDRSEREFSKELESNLQFHIEDNLQRGMTPQEARRQALIKLGGIEQAKEIHREQRGIPALDTIWQDVRFGLRMLRKNPGFTAVAVLTLALGIGANTAIFGVVNAVLLRPLAYRNPERLVTVLHDGDGPVAVANYIDWRDQSQSFEAMSAADYWTPNLTGAETPENLLGLRVTQNLFPMLGVEPLLGRLFVDGEDQKGSEHVVILSHRLWQRRFSSDTAVVGKQITLDGELYTIVGVMPPEFQFAPFWATRSELWAPNAFGERVHDRGGNSLRIFARRRAGVALDQARAEVAAITARLEQQYPGTNRGVKVTPLKENVVGGVQEPLLALLGAVGFVLLIACTNVAHMLLARASTRQRELAVRSALGAGRSRVVRQLLTENLLLATIGALAGLVLAHWGTQALVAISPPDIPRVETVTMDGRVLLFLFAATSLTAAMFGLVPALRNSKADLATSLKEGDRGSSEGAGRNRLRSFLVASEFALALMLLIAAGLMVRTFFALQSIDPGFDQRNVISMVVSVAGSKEAETHRREAFYRQLLEQIHTLPGVTSAGGINHLPLAGGIWGWPFTIEGRPKPRPGESPWGVYRIVMPGYFKTMRLPLVRGRDISDKDDASAPGVVIINERAASRYWPSEDPLGKRITFDDDKDNPSMWLTVIGVAKNAKQSDWAADPHPEVYLAALQNRDFLGDPGPHMAYLTLVVRTAGDPAALAPALKETVWSLDRNLPVSQVLTMDEVVATANARPRFEMLLFAVFAAIALVLAAVGIYGVMSYSVASRTRQYGIRIALGARAGDVFRLVLREAMALAMVGMAAGLIAGQAATSAMSKLLFGVEPTDLGVLAGVSILLAGVALLASYIPARRAARVDPMVALRYE